MAFKQVFPGPGANPANIGVRGLESTGFGLVVGTANPFFDIKDAEGNALGGIEVFVGTTAFEDNGVDVPPVARAGASSYLVFDTDRDGFVNVSLLRCGLPRCPPRWRLDRHPRVVYGEPSRKLRWGQFSRVHGYHLCNHGCLQGSCCW